MAQIVGTGTVAADLNARAIAIAQKWAATAWASIEFAHYCDGQGLSGLELAGFDVPGATAFLADADYMKQLALIFQGQATQGSAFDFSNALAALIGPTPGSI